MDVEFEIIDFTKDYYCNRLDRFTIERYVDYRDEFPESDIREILDSEEPYETFLAIIDQWDIDSDDWYYETDFWEQLEKFCKENNYDIDEAKDIVIGNFWWTYPEEFYNPTVDTVWTIDVGDGNYDFSCHNILNYCSGGKKELDNPSGLRWLAKQQKRLTLLNKEIKKSDRYSNGDCKSKFVESCITELINATSNLTHLSFLVKMPLRDAIRIEEYRMQLLKDKKYSAYHPQGCTEDLGYITLSKDTMCGLYDSYQGGGSLMEIELERDVKLPIQFLDSIQHTRRIQEVYGMTSDCWKETIKEINLKEGK